MNKSDQLLDQEFKEAWSHYRHVESDRSRYLSFFFTIVLATIGFLITITKDIGSGSTLSPWFIPGIFFLFWLLNVLAWFIYAGIKKSGHVLAHYDQVMWRIRDMVYDEPQKMRQLLSIRRAHPVMMMRTFSTQGLAEGLLLCAGILFDITAGFLIFATWKIGLSAIWIFAGMCLLWTILIAFKAYIALRLLMARNATRGLPAYEPLPRVELSRSMDSSGRDDLEEN